MTTAPNTRKGYGNAARLLLMLGTGSVAGVLFFFESPLLGMALFILTIFQRQSIEENNGTIFSSLTDVWGLGLDMAGDNLVIMQRHGKNLAQRAKGPLIEAANITGLCSDDQKEVLLAEEAQAIKSQQHIEELLLGHNNKASQTAVIASSESGKTTFYNWLAQRAIMRPMSQVIVLDSDYLDTNKGENVEPVLWGGLPRYVPQPSTPILDQSCVIKEGDYIYDAIVELDREYKRRERNGFDAKTDREIYIFFDEMGKRLAEISSRGDAHKERITAFLTQLINAKKYRIYIYPVLHDTKAVNGLNRNTYDSFNTLVMGSFADEIATNPRLENIKHLFRPTFLESVSRAKANHDTYNGVGSSDYTIAALTMRSSFVCSDGTRFAKGEHIVMIPDCRSERQTILVKSEAVADEAPEVDPVMQAANEFRDFLISEREVVEGNGVDSYSLTSFCKTFPGWVAPSHRKGPRYELLKQLTKDVGKQHPRITRDDLIYIINYQNDGHSN